MSIAGYVRLHVLADDCKIKLQNRNLPIPHIVTDFLEGESVDFGKLSQTLNAQNAEHDLKIGH